jgi:hypothetical protein
MALFFFIREKYKLSYERIGLWQQGYWKCKNYQVLLAFQNTQKGEEAK